MVVAALAMIGAAILVFAYTSIAAAIPAVVAFVVAMWPVLAVLGLVGVAAYLLYTAWTENWGGIQQVVLPIIENVKNALLSAWSWMSTVLWPFLVTLGGTIRDVLGGALAWMSQLWVGTLWPAMLAVYEWISVNLFPLFMALANFFGAVFNLALTAMAGVWQNVLLPALTQVGSWLQGTILPVFQSLGSFLSATFSPAIEGLATFLSGALLGAFEGISDAISDVIGFIESMTDALMNIKLPPWLTPGSPTPWEIGLRGINKEMDLLANQGLPALDANLQLQPANVPGLPTNNPASANSAQASDRVVIELHGNSPLDMEALAYRVAEIMQTRRTA